jgi:hypothetical protein
MSGNYEDIEPIEVNDERTPSEREHDRQLEELDEFFCQIDPSLKLLVWRLQPSWCRGFLEEIYVANAREDINLAYFIRNWGGQLLQLRVRGPKGQIVKSYMIPLYSYPPLVKRERIVEDDLDKPARSDTPIMPPQSAATPVVVNQGSGMEKILEILPAVIPLWSEYVKGQEARRQADMALMAQVIQARAGNGIGDITKIGSAMAQLQTIFQKNNADISDGGELGFMTQALDVVKSIMSQPSQPQQLPATGSPHKLAPPKKGKNRINGPDSQNLAPVTPIATPTPSKTVSASEAISQMNAADAAATIISAIGAMPAGKREDAINFIADEYDRMYPEDEDLEDKTGERGRK